MSTLARVVSAMMVLLLSPVSTRRKTTEFTMEEYASFDPVVYNYEEIVNEDIWDYKVVQKMGVIELTADLYTERVYQDTQANPEHKPWFICIIVPT